MMIQRTIASILALCLLFEAAVPAQTIRTLAVPEQAPLSSLIQPAPLLTPPLNISGAQTLGPSLGFSGIDIRMPASAIAPERTRTSAPARNVYLQAPSAPSASAKQETEDGQGTILLAQPDAPPPVSSIPTQIRSDRELLQDPGTSAYPESTVSEYAHNSSLFDGLKRKLQPLVLASSLFLPAPRSIPIQRGLLTQTSPSIHEPSFDPDSAFQPDGEGSAPLSRNDPASPSRSDPIPESIEVHSGLASVDDSFDHYTTHARQGVKAANHVQLLVDYIQGLVRKTNAYGPGQKTHLILKYYEIAHPRVLAAIKRAMRANIRITIITDFNSYIRSPSPQRQDPDTDFENAQYKNSQAGRAFRRLREELGFGLRLNEGPWTILSGEPLTNAERAPLMHDKVAVALGPDGKIYKYSLNGTANMNWRDENTRGPFPTYGGRYNSMYRIKDPVANQVDWDQAQAEMDAFDRREFMDIRRAHNPVRVLYQDGSYREIGFTFGKQNLNDRITEILKKAQDPKNNIKVKEVVFSHFSFTLTTLLENLRKLMKRQPEVKVFGVFDQQFIWPNGFGVAGALAQFLVQRPRGWGYAVYPFGSANASRMELYGYQRLKNEKTSPDIDMGNAHILAHLWHDKTTLVKTEEFDATAGRWNRYTYVFTRSFNGSNHYQNFESQDMYRFSGDSPKALEIEDSIKSTVKNEPDYAIDLSKAIVRDWLAEFTGHTPYQIDIRRFVDPVIDAFSQMDYSRIGELLSEILALPTKTAQDKLDKAKEHISKFIKFLHWHAKEASKDPTLYKISYKNAVNIGVAMFTGDTVYLRTALELLYYYPERPNSRTLALLKDAWTQGLGMRQPFPHENADDKPDVPPLPAPATLAGAFSDALARYHRLDEREDGSGQIETQYPPVPGIPQGNEEELNKFITRMSGFLESQPGFTYIPSPSDIYEKIDRRAKIQKETAEEIQEHALGELTAVIDSLRDPKIKAFVRKALDEAQPEFWRAPSSSSHRYHPADESNTGGLLVHSMRDVMVGRMLARYFELTPQEFDIITAILLLHDIAKGGIPWKHDNDSQDSGYDPNHGPVAADWLKTFAEEMQCGADCAAIIEGVRNHMAQWNRPKPTPPRTLLEQIVSYADYLAGAQEDVYVQWRTNASEKDLRAKTAPLPAAKPASAS